MPDKIVLKSYHYVCAVAGSNEDPFENPDANLLIDGTGFFIGKDTIITANHAVSETYKYNFILQEIPGNQFQFVKFSISSIERFPKKDICVIRLSASVDTIGALVGSATELNMLDDVFSVGFPLALDPINRAIHTRSFKGHIICINSRHERGNIYELSFHCPRGLSGGPLIAVDSEGRVILKGVILGNDISDIEIESTIDIDEISGKTTVSKRVESYHRGIALQTADLFSIKSQILNCSIGEYFDTHLPPVN